MKFFNKKNEVEKDKNFFDVPLFERGDLSRLVVMSFIFMSPVIGVFSSVSLLICWILSKTGVNFSNGFQLTFIIVLSYFTSFSFCLYQLFDEKLHTFKRRFNLISSIELEEFIQSAEDIKSRLKNFPEIEISTTMKTHLSKDGYWDEKYFAFSYENEYLSIPDFFDDITIEGLRSQYGDDTKTAVYIDEILLHERLEKEISEGKKSKRIKI